MAVTSPGAPPGLGQALPGGGLGAGALDAPPPSPSMPSSPSSYAGLAPQVNSGSAPPMPPEILTGMMQVGEKIGQTLDSLAQVVPQLAADFGQVKDLLQSVLAKVMQQGGNPSSPSNAGSGFPGGGMDEGFTPPQVH